MSDAEIVDWFIYKGPHLSNKEQEEAIEKTGKIVSPTVLKILVTSNFLNVNMQCEAIKRIQDAKFLTALAENKLGGTYW